MRAPDDNVPIFDPSTSLPGGESSRTATHDPVMFQPHVSSLSSAEGEVQPSPYRTLPGDRCGEPGAIIPTAIGRYRVLRLLGQGTYGRVFLAHDDDLNRPVAIKVPQPGPVVSAGDVAAYLNEARLVAGLEHPHIVPVYDAGRTPDGLCYIVSRYVEGIDLAAWMARDRPHHGEAAALVANVAEALHHAHSRGIFHRDVKPANILIDSNGQPFVTDFGLALKDEDFGLGARRAGTPAYMSPEQARGESHRVDGRSDIFSLGVVFYELLTGWRPFRAEDRPALLDQIATADPRPPREFDDAIPKELERICLKALARRAIDRYPTARDLAEDLRGFLTGEASPVLTDLSAHPGSSPLCRNGAPSSISGPTLSSDSDESTVKVVPRGLRAFDERDAGFFLDLLPGPRDRQGLPRGIQFWKDFIEETDPDRTFPVGLIYGPSGCGKSSLVRAGLLPRLDRRILRVYVEAASGETETRLGRGLRKACPDLSATLDLPAALQALRTRPLLRSGQKMLLVLDQFEQWLHAHRGEGNGELIRALRHCDGEHVQAIVLVRDDFWMASTRFLAALEVRLLEGENSAAVDRFDREHARKVLAAFGRAFGRLPERLCEQTRDQETFLDQVVAGLSQEGQVIPVRLALFAELVKARPWTPASLRQGGGVAGVGVTFLEETFSSWTAPPEHRLHQEAAQSVLKALLPEIGSDIKGRMRSSEALREASGYVHRAREFDALIRILDVELRLITPTEPVGPASSSTAPEPGPGDPRAGRYYQLTHDYLVPALREWLTHKQRETRRGRAALRLAEHAALWNDKPEDRLLPSAVEWANLRLLTRKEDWTGWERPMMERAGRIHGLRALGLTILLGLASWGGIEAYGNLRASERVESLKTANTSGVPTLIEQLRSDRRWAGRYLQRLLGSTEPDGDVHLRASLASLALFPDDRRQVEYLLDRLLVASPADLPVISAILREHHPETADRLWSVLDDATADPDRRFRAACALAGTDTESAAVADRWDTAAPLIADRFLRTAIENPGDYKTLLETLRPLRKRLLRPLGKIFRESSRSENDRTFATTILVRYASDDPDLLVDLLLDAGPEAYARLFPVVEHQSARALAVLRAEMARDLPSEPEEVRDRLAQRQARAAVALVRLGHAEEVWPVLQHSRDPRLRSFIVNWLSPLGADPEPIVAEFHRLNPPAPRHAPPVTRKMDAILFDRATSIQRALILSLGTYGTDGLASVERETLIRTLLDLYRNHPDSGIHGAAEWALRQWKQDEALKAADDALKQLKEQDRGERRWYVNREGQTFAIIEGPVEFRMGSPPGEPGRLDENETPHRRVIRHRFAIAVKEVSVEQYMRFGKGNPGFDIRQVYLDRGSPRRDGAMISRAWFQAAGYCNWLSKKEGLPEDQWCYLPNQKGEYDMGMTIPADVMQRRGYRLPTEAEWEYACRAGAITSRYYGTSDDLLGNYAWYLANSAGVHAWSCGSSLPNDLGLFDMFGNVYEWCQDPWGGPYQPGREEAPTSGIIRNTPRILRGGSFTSSPLFLRTANRTWNEPTVQDAIIGFRLARTY